MSPGYTQIDANPLPNTRGIAPVAGRTSVNGINFECKICHFFLICQYIVMSDKEICHILMYPSIYFLYLKLQRKY